MRKTVAGARIVLFRGDITRERVDAIVNAANSSLMGGGGVDGAIHRAGGPAVLEECRRIRGAYGPLPPGRAVVTTAGDLPARWVIHTVGPVWHGGGRGEDDLLRSCYRASLDRAREVGARTVAFPSISTGAYRFPVERAAGIALRAVAEWLEEHGGEAGGPPVEEVRFILFSDPDLEVYARALDALE